MSQPATMIDRVEVFGYDLTYAHGEYVMSTGRVVDRLPSTVVRIDDPVGDRGLWRDVPARDHVPAGVRRRGARRAAGAGARASRRRCREPRGRQRHDGCHSPRSRYAKSAIDIACWDILGRVTNQPVAMLLGGVLQERLPLYVAVPLG